jgi:hypothetical protein
MPPNPAAAVDPRIVTAYTVEQAVRRARAGLHEFGPLVVRDGTGKPIQYAPIHYAWIAHVNYAWAHGLHAGIFAHMGSGKTSSFLVPLAAWLIGKNIYERIKVVCNGDDAASKRVNAVKRMIESRAYQMVFPNVQQGDKWTDHMLFVERDSGAIDPTIEARGVFTRGVGGRATTLLFDDVCDLNNSITQDMRDQVREHVYQVWLTRLESTADRALWIATPWSDDDCSYTLRNSPNWCWLEIRVNNALTAYEREVFNAGPEYEAYTEANMAEMMAPVFPPGQGS